MDRVNNRALPLLVLSAACAGAGPAAGQAPAPLGSRAREAWADYEAAARTWSYRIRTDFTTRDHGRVTDSSVGLATVRANRRCALIEQSSPGEPGRDPEAKARECRVVNAEYQFSARQAPGAKGWALTSVSDLAAVKSTGEYGRVSMRDDIETGSILAPVSVETITVRKLIDHPCCHTDRLALTPGGVEWVFRIDPAKRPQRMRQIERGRVLFDPANRWVIKEAVTEARNGAGGISTIRQAFGYAAGPNGYPVPTELRTSLETDDKSFAIDGTTTFELVGRDKPPADAEFTLTAFGIPEAARRTATLREMAANQVVSQSPAEDTNPTPWYWWLTAASGVLLAVGVALLAAARFRRPPNQGRA